MGSNPELGSIAAALLAALPESALDDLARRVAAHSVQPALLDRASAAKYLSISTEALRKNKKIKPVYLDGCATKPLYRVCDLDTAISTAARRNGVR
jgi:hypothetical protein